MNNFATTRCDKVPDTRAPEAPQSSMRTESPRYFLCRHTPTSTSFVCVGETKACQLDRWGANAKDLKPWSAALNLRSAPTLPTGCHVCVLDSGKRCCGASRTKPQHFHLTIMAPSDVPHPSAFTVGSACLVAVLMSVWLAQRKTRTKSAGLPYPPGLKELPLIGILLSIDMKGPCVTYTECAKMYGSFFASSSLRSGDEWRMHRNFYIIRPSEPTPQISTKICIYMATVVLEVACDHEAKGRGDPVVAAIREVARMTIEAITAEWPVGFTATAPLCRERIEKVLDEVFMAAKSQMDSNTLQNCMVSEFLQNESSKKAAKYAVGTVCVGRDFEDKERAFPMSQPKMTSMKGATSRKDPQFLAVSRLGVISLIRSIPILIASYYQMDNSSHKPSRIWRGRFLADNGVWAGMATILSTLRIDKVTDALRNEIKVEPVFTSGVRVSSQTVLAAFMSIRKSSTDQPADSVQKPVEVWKFEDDVDDAIRIAFFPDGNRLLVWGGKSMKVLTMEERVSEVMVMKSDMGFIAAAIFPDCRRVLSGHEDGGLKVWDCETGKILEVWKMDNEDPVTDADGMPIDAVFCPPSSQFRLIDRRITLTYLICQQHLDYMSLVLPGEMLQPLVPHRNWRDCIRPGSPSGKAFVAISQSPQLPQPRASHPEIYQRHAAAEETTPVSQLPANLPTIPGHYETFDIVAFTPPTDARSLDDDPNEVTTETTGHAAFCGLCSKLPFRRSKHHNNSGARNSVVEISST
ncbi:hypothetical protein BU15DRAFT_68102 [Melanogaster broomeanus]|nr:hypothetical protein BU15DRAFT_68102 [Melanogaster broomeanus]